VITGIWGKGLRDSGSSPISRVAYGTAPFPFEEGHLNIEDGYIINSRAENADL